MTSKPQYLSGNANKIAEFIDKFDVRDLHSSYYTGSMLTYVL